MTRDLLGDQLREVTTDELASLRQRDPECRIGVIVPVGAVEQHGAVLPVTCDVDIAVGAASAVARALNVGSNVRAFVAPAIPYGPVPGAAGTAGTAAVEFDVFGAYLTAVVSGFAATGIWDFIVIVNAHGHNHGRVIEASSRTYAEWRIPVLVLQVYDYVGSCDGVDLVPGSHAGEFEIALHRYYSGVEPRAHGIPNAPEPLPRPASVYGLDLAPRSFGGVVAPAPPSITRALAASDEVGRRIDRALVARVQADLITYFDHWQVARPRPSETTS